MVRRNTLKRNRYNGNYGFFQKYDQGLPYTNKLYDDLRLQVTKQYKFMNKLEEITIQFVILTVVGHEISIKYFVNFNHNRLHGFKKDITITAKVMYMYYGNP